MHTLQVLEKKLGYTFRCKEQLQAALYHSSYANEHRCCGVSSNERLEFLGDAVLGLVTADYLYHKHPDLPEGDLTRMRAALVCEESLYEVAQSLGLGNELRLGKGEEAGGGRCRPSILADATESVFAAVYLDGGMEAARALIHRVLLDKEQEEAVEERRRDYKTELQELVQRRSYQTLHYEMIGATGPDHAKLFTCAVLLNGQMAGTGTGKSKKAAEQAAARAALRTFPPYVHKKFPFLMKRISCRTENLSKASPKNRTKVLPASPNLSILQAHSMISTKHNGRESHPASDNGYRK